LHHPQSPFTASKPLPVDDPAEDNKLHSSFGSNSKTSMADSSGHLNDAGKKLLVHLLHHQVTSRPHQMILLRIRIMIVRMVQVQHQHEVVGKI
jgi:hypothetical protein